MPIRFTGVPLPGPFRWSPRRKPRRGRGGPGVVFVVCFVVSAIAITPSWVWVNLVIVATLLVGLWIALRVGR